MGCSAVKGVSVLSINCPSLYSLLCSMPAARSQTGRYFGKSMGKKSRRELTRLSVLKAVTRPRLK